MGILTSIDLFSGASGLSESIEVCPEVVEFQTVTACNARCQVCPYPAVRGGGRPARMPEEIWHRILEGIADLRPRRVIPYLNNEPLADSRLPERIRAIKEIGDQIEIEVSTNGLLLNEEMAEALMVAGATEILVSAFGYDGDSHREIMGLDFKRVRDNVLGALRVRERLAAVTSINIIQVDVPGVDPRLLDGAKATWEEAGIPVRRYGYLDRAGNVDPALVGGGQRNASLTPRGCELNRHRERMYFLTDGTAVLCCHDWRVRHAIGSLEQSTMREIWFSSVYSFNRRAVDGTAPSEESFLCRHCKLCPSS